MSPSTYVVRAEASEGRPKRQDPVSNVRDGALPMDRPVGAGGDRSDRNGPGYVGPDLGLASPSRGQRLASPNSLAAGSRGQRPVLPSRGEARPRRRTASSEHLCRHRLQPPPTRLRAPGPASHSMPSPRRSGQLRADRQDGGGPDVQRRWPPRPSGRAARRPFDETCGVCCIGRGRDRAGWADASPSRCRGSAGVQLRRIPVPTALGPAVPPARKHNLGHRLLLGSSVTNTRCLTRCS